MRKISLAVSTLLLCALLMVVPAGCRHNPVNTNPAVVAAVTLTDASNTTKLLEDTLTTANHSIELVETSDPTYYAHAKGLFKKISAANRLAADKINVSMQGQPTDWKTAFAGIASSVDVRDLSTVQVANPNTQLLIEAAIQALVKIVTSVH